MRVNCLRYSCGSLSVRENEAESGAAGPSRLTLDPSERQRQQARFRQQSYNLHVRMTLADERGWPSAD